MHKAQTLWQYLCELLFPPPRTIGDFRTLSSSVLARSVTQPQVRRAVSCIAPLPFSHAMVRATVHAAKYHRHTHAAKLLGEVLAPFLAEELAERRMFGTYLDAIVVPVPLHAARLRERGFNQAERIAHALVTALHDPSVCVASDLLVRTQNTEHQTRMSTRKKRLQNMRDAFVAPEPNCIQGNDFILLDDVVTTGATLHAAEQALRDAGARHVLCVAAAH